MKAEILSVGTELLLGQIVDTNAAYIARRLAELGVALYRKTTVGDNLSRVSAAVREALRRADIVIATGGLGPTEDDLTREAVADALSVGLVESPEVLADLARFFAARGACMTENNRRQALMPEPGAGRLIPNPLGTAPGVLFEAGDKRVICLPGVPREMERMMNSWVVPYLGDLRRGPDSAQVIKSKVVRTSGIGESALEALIVDLAHDHDNPTVATYAGGGECQVRITARADSEPEADALIQSVLAPIGARLGRLVYGYDADTLEEVVGRLLARAGSTIACAESCTGGLVSAMLTNVPGSSGYFDRGVVTYSNRAKIQQLAVDETTLAAHGAVSRDTAIEMAAGVARIAGVDIGLSITGIAGPGGGTDAKPVGTVHFALAHMRRPAVITARMRFGGDRAAVRTRAAKFALDLVRRHLVGNCQDHPADHPATGQ
ncbi:MAG: competence/damage-inducible protein A [Firmicutes bacterium]|jgi:nicotinamide-nucleotide amidase|nr:competence/damage-inducible protein A [Bacillota bacterium]